jgi:hypothetical protein
MTLMKLQFVALLFAILVVLIANATILKILVPLKKGIQGVCALESVKDTHQLHQLRH